jgi:hypothetical protein
MNQYSSCLQTLGCPSFGSDISDAKQCWLMLPIGFESQLAKSLAAVISKFEPK